MNIINLKDCNLVDIETNIQLYDNGKWGSYHETNVTKEVSFIFDNGEKFVCNLFEVDLARFLDFFYRWLRSYHISYLLLHLIFV